MKSYRPATLGSRIAFGITLFISLTLLLGSCGKRPGPVGISTAPPWPQAYDDAIADALNPEPREIAHNLVAITRDNPTLQWKQINGIPHVLMVSLTGNTTYYENNVGHPYNTGTYDLWVTASPEMKQICGSLDLTGEQLKMRLRELLGLVPDAGVLAFVEFWVKPGDLFRPAPDNEIDDTTAGLNLPDNTPAWYRKWFNQLRAGQYFQSAEPDHNAYPWTQLGYTYDWGNPQSEQGLSEFVIKENSQVVIQAIHPFGNYCR
ncbi:MAG: hypothetical protein JEZ12_25855 [Desulfobacterium sp.]|nr:hypothetical protein [Desulfobacterium sp.]